MSSEILFTNPELRRHGVTRPDRDARLRSPRRGVWTDADAVPAGRTEQYRLTVRAAHETLRGDHVFSHESAAVLLGLPTLHGWPERVHLICERRSGGRSQRDVVRHCIGVEHVRPLLVAGILVTSAGRTAFDIALSRSFEEAVVVADAAFRLYPGARVEFATLLDAYGNGRNHERAADALLFSDERSGSAWESVSRLEIERLGFEKPDLQVRVVTDDREEFGDFGWPTSRSLGEFDGEVKYREDRYRQGGSVEDVVIREKNRENRMRVQWPNFARWDSRDIRAGRLEQILLDAAVRRRAGRFPSRFARYFGLPRRP